VCLAGGMTTDPDPRVRIREYPNKLGYGMAVDEYSSRKVIGAQLPLWQMQFVCLLTGCSWVTIKAGA